MCIKVILLDVDGVLNDINDLSEFYEKHDSNECISPTKVARLNQIIEATGAVCVLSSSWRNYFSIEKMREKLTEAGFIGELIDYTPKSRLSYRPRGHEIQEWLDENEHLDITSFVILDDYNDMEHLLDRLVQTDYIPEKEETEAGLLDQHVKQAIEILNKPTWKKP